MWDPYYMYNNVKEMTMLQQDDVVKATSSFSE